MPRQCENKLPGPAARVSHKLRAPKGEMPLCSNPCTTTVPSPHIQRECLLTLLKAKGFPYAADREDTERNKEDNRLPEAQFTHPKINESFQLNYLP